MCQARVGHALTFVRCTDQFHSLSPVNAPVEGAGLIKLAIGDSSYPVIMQAE